jgi:uncharacterized membrane protein
VEWLVFALFAPVLWAVCAVIDKFVLSKYIKNPFSYPAIVGCIYVLFSILIFSFTTVSFVFPYSIFAILVGALTMVFLIFYAKAMIVEDASRVTIFYNLVPLFVALIAAIFLNEVLTLTKYIGILLLIIGVTLVSYRKVKKKMSLVPTLKFLLPLPVFFAVTAVLNKWLLSYMNYWSLYSWGALGIFTFGMSLLSFRMIRNSFIMTFKRPKVISLVFIGEFFSASATISFFIAMSLGYVSLTSAIESLYSFFVFIFVIILSLFLPKILKEDISKQNILLKLMAIALIFIGTYLIVG